MKAFFSVLIFLFSFHFANAQQPRLMLPIGHTDGILEANFSPNGKYFITASDGGVMLWEAGTGRLLQNIKGNAVGGFTPNGKTIISYQHESDSTGAIQLIDLLSGKVLDSLDGYSINFNKAGDKALISTSQRTIKYWDYKTKKTIFELKGVLGVFLQDERYMLIVTDSHRNEVGVFSNYSYVFNVWDLNANKIVQTYKGHLAGFSNKYICVAEEDQLQIINTISGDTVQHFSIPPDEQKKAGDYISYRVKFSRDNSLMVIYPKFQATYFLTLETESFTVKKHFQYPQGQTVSEVFISSDSKSIIAVDEDSSAIAFNAFSGDTLYYLKGHHRSIFGLQFSPDKKFILTNSLDNKAILWDAYTGARQKTFEGKNAMPVEIKVSPDGSYFAYFLNNNLMLYETSTFRKRFSIPMEDVPITYTPDSRYLLLYRKYKSSDGDPLLRKIDIKTGSTIYNFKYSEDSGFYKYSPDGSMIAMQKKNNNAEYLNVYNEKKEQLLSIKYNESNILNRVIFSTDKKYCIVSYTVNWKKENERDEIVCYLVKDGTINWTYSSIYIDNDFEINERKEKLVLRTGITDSSFMYLDLHNGQPFHQITADKRLAKFGFEEPQIKFSPDGNIFSIKRHNAINFYDFDTQRLLLEIEPMSHLVFLEYIDQRKVLLCNQQNIVEIWDLTTKKKLSERRMNSFLQAKSGDNYVSSNNYFFYLFNKNFKELCSFINLGIENDITLIEGGYYQSTQSAAKSLYYVTKGLKTIGFEQLDVKYNRPDKVLKSIGNTDTALINSYRKAYEKRIKKLGIDTTAFREGYSVPEADFANRDGIEYEQKSGTLKLHIKANDSTYQLDRFNIWVNEAPLYGQRGISLKRKNRNNIDTLITIALSQGENRIETSITNVNGTESYRMPLIVNYTPAVKQKEMTRFIGIGIDKFSDSQHNLEYSSKDIRDLAKKLKEKYKDDIIIDTLFNENVTVSNVKALKQKLQQTSINDKVIISYSGHGLLSKDYDYYLSTYSVNFQKPEENGLAYDELENLLDSIPARKKLLLIDACHSGEVDKEEGIAMQRMADSLGLTKGIIIDDSTIQTQQLGLKNSFELMQSLFVNVGKSTGATIISAAAGNQFALERGDLKNGVFTYSLLEAMDKNKTIKISELKKIVGERVEQLTNGMQKPTSRNETIAVDWNLW